MKQETLLKPKSGKPKYIAIKILAVVLFIYAFYCFIQVNIEVKAERERLEAVQAELKNINSANEQLERDSSDEYIGEYMERIARDEMGYSDPNERVYYVAPGS